MAIFAGGPFCAARDGASHPTPLQLKAVDKER
jgi:hypothetical protein